MSIRPLLKLGNPLLRRKAENVDLSSLHDPDMQQLIDDMIETMHAAHGAGLAAPQVGVNLRLAVAEVRDNPRYPGLGSLPLSVWVNPVRTILSDRIVVEMYEGCLSVPGLRGLVRRPGHVRLSAVDRFGEPFEQDFDGPLAAVVGHELDHLDGVLFVDHADSKTLTFLDEYDQFPENEKRIRVYWP